MLPYLQPKKMASVIMQARKPDGSTEVVGEKDEIKPALMAVAEDLIRATHAKDAKGVATALEAAFSVCGEEDEPEASEGVENNG